MELKQFELLTAQSQMTLLAGLNWLAFHGDIQFQIVENGEIRLSVPGIWDSMKLENAQKELKTLLNETRAFRSYYLRADFSNLLQNN